MSEIRQRKSRSRRTKVSENYEADAKTKKVTSSFPLWTLLSWLSVPLCLISMTACGYGHAKFMYQIHENLLWFTNIKEVEREISFRTESGLYYSYYKQMVNAKSIQKGLYELTHDNLTEHPSTINVLERMNIYQEVVLAVLFRILPLPSSLAPIFFYINSVFALHAMLVGALFMMAYFLSGSWLAGILTASFYTFNRLDTTRVEYIIPLRESFSLPFLWVQVAAISYFFKPKLSSVKQVLSKSLILVSTFLFALFWQFNQFILMLQSFSLFGVWVLDMIPSRKIRSVFLLQVTAMLGVCAAQFGNKMILGSLFMSFVPAALIVMYIKGEELRPCSIPSRIVKVVSFSLLSLLLMFLINITIKVLINIEADEHIYKFVMSKFGVGNARDFDARLYLCLEAFGFLTFDVFERMTKGIVFPLYALTHIALLMVLFVAVLQNWSNHVLDRSLKETSENKKPHILCSRPELAFHTVQTVFFGALAMTTLRMKYLWTPYMCVFAGVGVSDYHLWKAVLSKAQVSDIVVQMVRHLATLLTLALLLFIALPVALKDLEDLKEFWDPDTVQLMEWIKKETPKAASFTGSMQLLAGVKLCTGRPITNHPHYEDKLLRAKTKDLYQIYGRRTPKDVHDILKKYKSNYIILEDSICLAPSKGGCRTPDLIDVDNGHIPDSGIIEPGLTKSSVPRFCDEVRHGRGEYAKYFKSVMTNKTFRVYKVLK